MSVLGQLAAPRTIRLSGNHWRAAARLAGLRKGVNDGQRSEHRSRGEGKNLLNDLQGAIGEIVALMAVEACGARGVQHHPISFEAHVDDVDLRLADAGGVVGLEAKCLLVENGKRRFLVNKKAHERSVARGAVGFIPVLTAEGAPQALVGRVVPVHELERWAVVDFGYGDPAYSLPLREACRSLFGHPEPEVRRGFKEIAGRYGSLATGLGEEARGGARDVRHYERSLPPLGNVTAAELVEALCSV